MFEAALFVFLLFVALCGVGVVVLGGGARIEARLQRRETARQAALAANVTPIGRSPLDASIDRHPSGRG